MIFPSLLQLNPDLVQSRFGRLKLLAHRFGLFRISLPGSLELLDMLDIQILDEQ